MELWDIYNENRVKTGRTLVRDSGEKLKDGEYHLIAQAIVINKKGEIFLGQRSELKKNYPLMWETIGGSVIKGEDTLQGIIRELKEELGVTFTVNEAKLFKTIKNRTTKVLKDIWVFYKDFEIEQLTFPDNEVIGAKWVNIKEFEKMLNNGELVKNIDLNIEDMKKAIKKD